jgi:hypothetical protein
MFNKKGIVLTKIDDNNWSVTNNLEGKLEFTDGFNFVNNNASSEWININFMPQPSDIVISSDRYSLSKDEKIANVSATLINCSGNLTASSWSYSAVITQYGKNPQPTTEGYDILRDQDNKIVIIDDNNVNPVSGIVVTLTITCTTDIGETCTTPLVINLYGISGVSAQ